MYTFIRDQLWLQNLIHKYIRKLPGPDQFWQQKVISRPRMLNGPVLCLCIGRTEKDVFSSCMHAVFRQDRCVMDLSPCIENGSEQQQVEWNPAL